MNQKLNHKNQLNLFERTRLKNNLLHQKYKVIDLFAGIGGLRLGFEKFGCEFVFASEWDKHAQLTYELNYKDYVFEFILCLIKIHCCSYDLSNQLIRVE